MTVIEASKNNKWIWIGVAAAALFCLCAVAVAGLVFLRVGQQVQRGMKTDPQGAAEAAHAIADYELPKGYQEQFAMDFLAYSMVMIGHDSIGPASAVEEPLIVLSQFRLATNQRQMEEQVRQSLEQQTGYGGMSMKVVEVRKKTIRGEEVDVTTLEGANDHGLVMRQLITTFPGKNGTAMLMIMGPARYWDKEVIDHFVESIH